MESGNEWFIGVVTAVILYLIYWFQRPERFPPGPRGIPILGYIGIFNKPEEKIYELSKKYGSIFTIRIGSEDIVFLNDYESITQALVKHGTIFSGRPQFADLEKIKKGYGLAFVDYGDLWKTQRKFAVRTMRGFGVGKKEMENICVEELRYLNESIRKQNGQAFNISFILHNVVSNIICNLAFGNRFDYDDKRFVELLNLVIHVFDDPFLAFSSRIVAFVPAMVNIPPVSWGVKRLEDITRKNFDWMEEIIKEHEKTFDEKNLRDFIDAFIEEKRKKKDPTFTDFQLQNYLHDLFVAGSETTSSTLYWGLLCLLHYPETQRKLRKEVMDVLGSSGVVSYSKRSEMPYTNAFIQELYRFRTLLPLNVLHKTSESTEFAGYMIPKDTKISTNLWAVHNDPKLWKDPQKFRPERFIDEKGNFIPSNYVISFGVGPRQCLGEQLARMEVFIFLVGMIQKFEFLPDPSQYELPIIEQGSLGFVYLPLPYKLVAHEH